MKLIFTQGRHHNNPNYIFLNLACQVHTFLQYNKLYSELSNNELPHMHFK